jgi:hypothetical protein
MRIINEKLHGLIDYLAAIALIAAPFVVFPADALPLAKWISAATGGVLILYSLFTNYSLSLAKTIPFGAHLMIDLLAGAAYLVIPFALAFAGFVKLYFLVMGAAVIVVVLLTDPKIASAAGAKRA